MMMARCLPYAAAMATDEPQIEHRNGFFIEALGAKSVAAHHEAGHLLAAKAFGEHAPDTVLRVVFVRGNHGDVFADHHGYCGEWRRGGYDLAIRERPKIPDIPPGKNGFVAPAGIKLKPAIITCAGPAAEWRFCATRGFPQRLKYSAESDRRTLENYAQIEKNACGSDKEEFVERAWRAAQSFLDDPVQWAAVEAIAGELITGLGKATPETPKAGDEAEFVLSFAQAEAIMSKAGLVGGEFAARLQEREGFRRAA
jgi:hypothetical protein